MKNTVILIVTRSIALQQGLGALLESLSEALTVKAIKDLQGAYTWMEEHQPRVVLLDEKLAARNPKSVLEKIRTISPDTQRALLVDNVEEGNSLTTHAEAILIKGISPFVIASTITSLLSADQGKSTLLGAYRDL